MKTQDFLSQLRNSYLNHFPNSRIVVDYRTALYRSIWIRLYLAGNEDQLSGGYWDNDMLHITFQVESETGEFSRDVTLDSELAENLVLENTNKFYHIKPKNPHLFYGRRSLSFRKCSGNVEKIIKQFDKFCIQLKTTLQDDFECDNIHKNHETVVKRNLGLA